ncbi:biorientation of chromosomes in cell division [Sparganum proliferum]
MTNKLLRFNSSICIVKVGPANTSPINRNKGCAHARAGLVLHTSMDTTPGTVTPGTLVTKLKSQGFFDKVRKRCLECVESEEEYHKLLQNVDSMVSRFLQRQPWPPRLGRLELRERLRRELCSSAFLQRSISLISAALVKAQPSETLRPSIEHVVCESLDVDYQKWQARREAKGKTDFSTLPSVLPTLVPPPPLPFQTPDSTLPTLASSTIPQPTPFPFMPANFCQIPPPIHPITNPPSLQPQFHAQTLPTDAQIHISSAVAHPTPALPSLRQNAASEEATDSLACQKTGTEANALITDGELDVAGEELLQCDDSMDVESSDSQASPVSDKKAKEQDDTAYMPNEDIAFLPSSSTHPEQASARQVVWEGVKMELDDISDEEVANQFRTRILPQTTPEESAAAAKVALQTGSMSPLRRRLSACRPSKRDSPPPQLDDRQNFSNYLLSGRCPEPPGDKFVCALDSRYAAAATTTTTSPSSSPRGSPNFRRSRESDRLRKNPSPEITDFQGRRQRHWNVGKISRNRISPLARNSSPRHRPRIVNEEPDRVMRASELENRSNRMNSRFRQEDNNFSHRSLSPTRKHSFRPSNREVSHHHHHHQHHHQDHHRNRSPVLKGQRHSNGNYESDRYAQQRSCSQRHSHRQNGNSPCGRSSVRQTNTLSSCSRSPSPRGFANATTTSPASSPTSPSQRHASSLRPHAGSPSRHVGRFGPVGGTTSTGDRFVARSSLPPTQSHRRRQASPHTLVSPLATSSHYAGDNASDGRWKQSQRRSHAAFDPSSPSGSECSTGQHGYRNPALSSTERHSSSKDRVHSYRQSARGFDPSSR